MWSDVYFSFRVLPVKILRMCLWYGGTSITFLEASGWRACRMTRGLLTQSVQELLPRHFTSDDTVCWNCIMKQRGEQNITLNTDIIE